MRTQSCVALDYGTVDHSDRARTLTVPVDKRIVDRLDFKAYSISQKSEEKAPALGAAPSPWETGFMPRALSAPEQCLVIHDLCEGASINSIVRKHGVAKTTILRLLVRVGLGCKRLHDRLFRALSCALLQCDEIWSYVGKKEARVTAQDPAGWGEAYTFVGLDVASRAVVAYHVGRRAEDATRAFIDDLRARLTLVPQITTDGFTPYIKTIGEAFGGFVEYAMTIKRYSRGGRRDDDHRYEPPRDPFITKKTIFGVPDMERASTALIERQNRTMRMHIRRMTRLCDGFSKKRENHEAANALHFAYYNLVKIHETVKTAPGVALGVIEKPWTIGELIEAALAEPQGELPIAGPLALRPNVGAARELPNGRGFLRLVGALGAAPVPSAPSVHVAPVKLAEVPAPAQGDLFAWAASRPAKSAPLGQLSLFGDDK